LAIFFDVFVSIYSGYGSKGISIFGSGDSRISSCDGFIYEPLNEIILFGKLIIAPVLIGLKLFFPLSWNFAVDDELGWSKVESDDVLGSSPKPSDDICACKFITESIFALGVSYGFSTTNGLFFGIARVLANYSFCS
jgi:hypothetical protein